MPIERYDDYKSSHSIDTLIEKLRAERDDPRADPRHRLLARFMLELTPAVSRALDADMEAQHKIPQDERVHPIAMLPNVLMSIAMTIIASTVDEGQPEDRKKSMQYVLAGFSELMSARIKFGVPKIDPLQ